MTNDFFTNFEKKCNKVNIPEKDIKKAKTYLEQILKKTKIIDWYIAIGPLSPSFPDIILDCFILTEKFLINCDFKKIPLINMLPLIDIISISETVKGKLIGIEINSPGYGGGIVIADSLRKRDELENFANKIRHKLLELK